MGHRLTVISIAAINTGRLQAASLALEAAANSIKWDYNTVKEGKLAWACEEILALKTNPEALAAIKAKAEGRG